MAKEKETGALNKGVYFNLDKPMDKMLHDYVTGPSVTNYSAFIKGLIYNHMQQTGGVINPYQMVEQPVEMEPVNVKVFPSKQVAGRMLREEVEQEYELPQSEEETASVEEPEEDREEELAQTSTKLSNFGAMSARERRAAKKNGQ